MDGIHIVSCSQGIVQSLNVVITPTSLRMSKGKIPVLFQIEFNILLLIHN